MHILPNYSDEQFCFKAINLLPPLKFRDEHSCMCYIVIVQVQLLWSTGTSDRVSRFRSKRTVRLLRRAAEFRGCIYTSYQSEGKCINYWVTQKLPQIYVANHATFPIWIRIITVQICGNFWVTKYKVYKCSINTETF